MSNYRCYETTDFMDVDFGVFGVRECLFTFKESVEGDRNSFPTVTCLIEKMEVESGNGGMVDRTDLIDEPIIRQRLQRLLEQRREAHIYAEENYGVMEKSEGA